MEIVSALHKINFEWWNLIAYWIPSRKSIQLNIGDFNLLFDCVQSVNEPGVDEDMLIEGNYIYNKNGLNIEIRIIYEGNKICRCKLNVK